MGFGGGQGRRAGFAYRILRLSPGSMQAVLVSQHAPPGGTPEHCSWSSPEHRWGGLKIKKRENRVQKKPGGWFRGSIGPGVGPWHFVAP